MKITEINDFISIVEAKSYMRVEHALDDALIVDLVTAATEQVDAFLQNEFIEQDETGEWVNLPVPFSIKLAALKTAAYLYENRGDTGKEGIPGDALRLLYPYRKLVGT